MTDTLITLTPVLSGRDTYRIGFDGKVFGDSKGYSYSGCLMAIDHEIATDQRDAVKYNRPVRYCKPSQS